MAVWGAWTEVWCGSTLKSPSLGSGGWWCNELQTWRKGALSFCQPHLDLRPQKRLWSLFFSAHHGPYHRHTDRGQQTISEVSHYVKCMPASPVHSMFLQWRDGSSQKSSKRCFGRLDPTKAKSSSCFVDFWDCPDSHQRPSLRDSNFTMCLFL